MSVTLIESTTRYNWHVRHTAISVAAHVAFAALLVSNVRQVETPVRPGRTGANVQRLLYLRLAHAASTSDGAPHVMSPRRELRRSRSSFSPERIADEIEQIMAQHAKLLEVPVIPGLMPLEPPDIGLLYSALLGDEFSGEGSVAAALRGRRAAVDIANRSGPFEETEVETPVDALGDNPVPHYPGSLQAAGIEGEVVAEFVVDSTGRVERKSLRILSSTHALFALAVKEALVRSRFYPALIGDRAVRMRARQPFWFRLLGR